MMTNTPAHEVLRAAAEAGKFDPIDVLVRMLTAAGALSEWDSATIEDVLRPAFDATEAAQVPWVGNTGHNMDSHRYWAQIAEAIGYPHDFEEPDPATLTEVTLGFNVRRWADYEVTNLTDQERAVLLREDSPEAVQMLAQLKREGRAVFVTHQTEDDYDPFDAESDPAVVAVNDQQ